MPLILLLLLPQEYNICFTTVKRPTDGSMPALPTAANGAGSGSLAPLPTVIQGLVRKRREVKAQMKTCRWGLLCGEAQHCLLVGFEGRCSQVVVWRRRGEVPEQLFAHIIPKHHSQCTTGVHAWCMHA